MGGCLSAESSGHKGAPSSKARGRAPTGSTDGLGGAFNAPVITFARPKALSSASSETNTSEASNASYMQNSNKAFNRDFGFKRHVDRYKMDLQVGQGNFSNTCTATVLKGELKGQVVAIKVISKNSIVTQEQHANIVSEVRMLRALAGSKHVVRIVEALEDDLNVYIAQEWCAGGDLMDRMMERGGHYSEPEAAGVIRQVLTALAFLHLQGVIHRDIKPENFMFVSKEQDALLKVIDFGISTFILPDQRFVDSAGSAYYIAPEVLQRSYGVEADVWSLGVMTYIMLCGSRPFWGRTQSGIYKAVLTMEPTFAEPLWPTMSAHAKEFVERLLLKDPRQRPSPAQALAHPWIRAPGAGVPVNIPLDLMVFRLLRAYAKFPRFKRVALKALSTTMEDHELSYRRSQFWLLDANSDGIVTSQDYRAALERHTMDIAKQVRALDAEGLALVNQMEASPVLSWLEFEDFCAGTTNVHQMSAIPSWAERVATAHDRFEKDLMASLPSTKHWQRELSLLSIPEEEINSEDDKSATKDRLISLNGFIELLKPTKEETPMPGTPMSWTSKISVVSA